jgi:hypothetical protein
MNLKKDCFLSQQQIQMDPEPSNIVYQKNDETKE